MYASMLFIVRRSGYAMLPTSKVLINTRYLKWEVGMSGASRVGRRGWDVSHRFKFLPHSLILGRRRTHRRHIGT